LFRTRHPLLTALVATTLVVSVALGWAGWRLVVQERAIDERRALDAAESLATGITAAVRGRLAEAGERLNGLLTPPARPEPNGDNDGAVMLVLSADDVRIASTRRVPFVPFVPFAPFIGPQAPLDIFSAAESLEFGRGAERAAVEYQRLSSHRDERVRAGALLRLGRVLRNGGDHRGALAAYERLAGLGQVRTGDTGDLPAEFAALYGRRAALLAMGDVPAASRLAEQMRRRLDGGEWLVTRGVAEFYRDELGGGPLPGTWPLADAARQVWSEHDGTLPARGQQVVTTEGRNVLVLWRAAGGSTALMTAFLDDVFERDLPEDVLWQVTDSEGRRIAGAVTSPPDGVARIMGDASSPWTLHLASTSPPAGGTRRAIALMLTVTLIALWTATYLIARAIRREAAVSRLQSEFVAAVSHEFRSPLTTVRQMAEMLDLGRVPGEERRRAYYRIVAREAARLQRLVETLLDFGRMEAGATPYSFRDVDAASLVRNVARDLEPIARDAGKRLDVSGPPETIRVRADEAALSLALRNLIDNAIKYSNGTPSVRVEWAREQDGAAIRVVDQGLGIPREEQQAIFRKFVRGRTAIDANIKGTGIGLAMVAHIVAAHGGQVQLESQPGHGSTFTLRLPVAG
jgi:signal transduction histidine kinase